ncbi:hypothetical protein SmJEL517_g00096 [Synchytrium microbalum]|uniref:Piwi domain-containing protein n=1 Tax=Synchytrium microbalum TaxID=1806994 RepID=A0A507CJB6_9FUNG|nr:uncharacterized protein SmJEL517_g00096 [Synchytrium microbalum]TPX38294.1 hypothetical protein SmJEL517_g00096 [Synchytrium microbalum]
MVDISEGVAGLKLHTMQLARRPGPMTGSGIPKARETTIRVNYLKVNNLPNFSMIHYDVSFEPEIPPAFIRRVFHAFERQHRQSEAMGGNYVVFDGRKNMYSRCDLSFPDGATAHTFMVNEPEDADAEEILRRGGTTRERAVFKMKVRKVAVIPLNVLNGFTHGHMHGSTPQEAIQCLDIVLRHKPSLLYVTVGRNFYTRAGASTLGGGAEVWVGYHQALRPVIDNLKINVDVTASAFYEAGSLLRMVGKVLFTGVNELTLAAHNREMNDRDRQRLEKTLKGLRVETTHRGSKKRFKISKVHNQNAVQYTFEQNGRQVSIKEYFKTQYNVDIHFDLLPLIWVGDQKKALMPIEVCDITPGQRHIRKLNERQTSEMIKFTCKPPHERASKIREGVELFEYANNEYLRHFELGVEEDLFLSRARILDAPTIHFGGTGRGASEKVVQGGWRFHDKRFLDPCKVNSWAVLVFVSESTTPESAVRAFLDELYSTCEATGMTFQNKRPLIGHVNPSGNIEDTMKRAWKAAGDQVQQQPQLLVCVLPNVGVPLYAEIKRVSDTVLGVPSQCLQNKHVQSKKRQYCQNIALKLNVKLGGTNFVVSREELGWAVSEPTIVIGADVTVAAPHEKGKPAVIALVGSIDAKLGKFAAKLACFYAHAGKIKPTRVIYYRDGVSEGQFSEVLGQELNAIRTACTSIEQGYQMKITYVVVQKRHHTRFFPVESRDSDKSQNCLPGTVVDKDIVHPTDFEFYLQSHAGLQGTSRPGRYTVLFDENAVPAELIQNTTNQLASVFARANKSVSVTTPAYYANLLAARAKFHSRTGFLDSESVISAGSGGGDGQAVHEYGAVKPELLPCMWFL